MKVLHLGLDLVPSSGGTTRAVSDYSLAFANSEVVSFSNSKSYLDYVRSTGTTYLKPSSFPLLSAFFVPSISSFRVLLYKLISADALFIHSLFAFHTVIGLLWSLSTTKKIFLVPHGCLDPFVFRKCTILKYAWLYIIGHPLLRRTSSVLFASDNEALNAKKLTPFPFSYLVVGLPAPLISPANFTTCQVARRRQSLGLPVEARILVTYGRLHSIKRILDIVSVFSRVDFKNAHLLIFGPDGDLTQVNLSKYIVDHGAKNITLRGPVNRDDIFSLLSICDGYISWSARENFNYALVESMALGLPVILSAGNSLNSIVSNSKCGWTSTLDSDDELSRLIKEFYMAPASLLHTFSYNCVNLVKTRFSPAQFSRQLNLLLSS
jgi:glycosyltransferase involved in cell wall biosynthesis